MPKIKTAELIGPALNWAVATIDLRNEGLTFTMREGIAVGLDMTIEDGLVCVFLPGPRALDGVRARRKLHAPHALAYQPCSDPAQGQPIMERERIGATHCSNCGKHMAWKAGTDEVYGDFEGVSQFGPTILIAGMRAFVASKLGDTVDVPQELITAYPEAAL